MPILRLVAKANRWLAVSLLGLIFLSSGTFAAGASPIPIGQDGNVGPFKLKQVPLSDFVRQYAATSGTRIVVAGDWNDELRGSVTLFVPKPISTEALTELFHETLANNGYAVIDAPDHLGWIIVRARDARDALLPIYDGASVPATHRLVTAHFTLQHVTAEEAARTARSFMPANSRIIPASGHELFITDTGTNIRKNVAMFQLFDTAENAQALPSERSVRSRRPGQCPGNEHRIEKLVVEKLEIGDQQPGFTIPGAGPLGRSSAPSQQRQGKGGSQ